jgi:hypothetical protein
VALARIEAGIVALMADEEWRVEVELDDEGHGLTIGERLRALGLDDEARKQLGDRVVVTRDGSRVLLYARNEADAREAERTVRKLVADDNLTAEYTLTRWNPVEQDWTDPSKPIPAGVAPASNDDVEVPDPRYVVIEAYKPEFLRDLGL